MKHLFRLGPFLKPFILQISLSLLLLLLLTAIGLIVPTIIRQVIDFGIMQTQTSYLVISSIVLLGIGLLRALLNYAQRYLSEWIASHIGFDLRNRLYNHIQHLPFSFHDHSQSGQLISRCIEDVRAIERFAGFGVLEIVRIALLMVGITILLFVQQPRLATIAVIPLIPLLLLTFDFGKRIGKLFYKVDEALGALSAHLQENVIGVQVVRAFAREKFETSRFAEKNRHLYYARLTVMKNWSKIMPTSNLLVSLCTILILWFGGQMVIQGKMTVGEIVAFNAYLLMLAGPVQQLAWLVNSVGEADAGAQRSLEILDLRLEIQTPPDAITLGTLSGKVVFNNVDFQYLGESVAALKGIDFSILPNKIIALIGSTGSGKTSLINLIPRFYDVTKGCVMVDDVDVRNVDLTSLRKQIGIVLQTSLLFSTTIRENIAFGCPEESMDDIVAAAKAAQAHDFILELPQGYETVVGERGVTLSGGQRQRIAIARALLMNPRILILDDSTSSVDTETERMIQQALDFLMQGRTTFVIAHRLSTVRRADLILVMSNGQIVERGQHKELLELNGLYREIYDLQLRDQEQFREDMVSLQGIKRSEDSTSEKEAVSNNP
jgi:ATP-binding cassette subfamily B multidrug efflux pump